jgi:hypothetical protein
MNERSASSTDAASRSIVDLQTFPLGAELHQHEDLQSSEGWFFFPVHEVYLQDIDAPSSTLLHRTFEPLRSFTTFRATPQL